MKDDILIRELAYCFAGKNNFISDNFRDSFLLFRGKNYNNNININYTYKQEPMNK